MAVCFLHAYANPEHEQRTAALVRAALPEAAVSVSSEVLPEYREHERFITTALNAYVAPRMRRYLASLRRRLGQAGSPAQVSVMTSNGGVLPDSRIEALPVVSMLSGPAAGVTAACAVGAAAGFPNLIAYDMGGTSTDVCLIRNGAYRHGQWRQGRGLRGQGAADRHQLGRRRRRQHRRAERHAAC